MKSSEALLLVGLSLGSASCYDPRPAVRNGVSKRQVVTWLRRLKGLGTSHELRSLEDLEALCGRQPGAEPCDLLQDPGSTDAWGQRFFISRTEGGWVVRSAGPDKILNSDDDLVADQ